MKIGAQVVSHGRYVTFQTPDVAADVRRLAQTSHLLDFGSKQCSYSFAS
jgi:hypothetical protein